MHQHLEQMRCPLQWVKSCCHGIDEIKRQYKLLTLNDISGIITEKTTFLEYQISYPIKSLPQTVIIGILVMTFKN